MINSKKMFGFIAFILLLIQLIPGLLPQIQMFLFKGSVVIPFVFVKVLLSILLGFSILVYLKIPTNKVLIIYCLTFIFYLLLEIVYLSSNQFNTGYLIYGFNTYFYFLCIIPFSFLLEETVDFKKVVKLLLSISLPLCILGIIQYISKNPIVPIQSKDGSFVVTSWQFIDGRVRAFSLFDSGLSFGNFLCLMMSIIISKILQKDGSIYYNSLVLILVLVSIYMTITRNVYIEAISVLISTILLTLFIRRRMLIVLPIIFYLFGLVANNLIPEIALKYWRNSLLDLSTYYIRQNNWQVIKSLWLNHGLLHFIFGTGLVQSTKYQFTENIVIDNTFIAVGLFIGMIGIILYFLIMWMCWSYCLKITRINPNCFNLGVTAFFSNWMITGIYNINLIIYPVVFILFILTNKALDKNANIRWRMQM